MITCVTCERAQPDTEFIRERGYNTAPTKTCRTCRELGKRRYQDQKAHLFDTGEITSECHHCGDEYTYVKTTGKRRMYCSFNCKFAAGTKRRKEKPARQCACGSSEVSPNAPKPVCSDCRKDKRDLEKRRAYNRARRLRMYGLSQPEFDELLTLQRGRCGICATDEPGTKGWFVDHDHGCCSGVGSCGNCVRGILCQDCNFLLGNAKDSVDVLDRARKYLVANSQFKLKLQVVRPDG